MVFFKLGVMALSLLAVAGTLVSLLRSPRWWVRMFDFPRAQLGGLACVLLALYAVAAYRSDRLHGHEWALLALLAIVVVVQLVFILPYTKLWRRRVVQAREEVPRERRLRLFISNVSMSNRRIERWLEVTRSANPDIVAAVECDAWWDDQLRVLAEDYPHSVRRPQDNTYGMVLYSRLPLVEVEVRHLVEDDVPSIFAVAELPSGDRVRLVVVHPRPPRPDISQDATLRDAELVLVGYELKDSELPVVIAGDLNDVAWSHTTRRFQRVAGLLDPRIGRGRFSTFHADHWFLRYPLDHVFHSEDFALVDLRRLDHVGSDHFPFLIELALTARAEAEQEEPKPQEEDHQEAREAVEEAREELRSESRRERRERRRADR